MSYKEMSLGCVHISFIYKYGISIIFLTYVNLRVMLKYFSTLIQHLW